MRKIKPSTWLIIILIFALILRLTLFTGLNWSDDPGYANDANRVSHGTFYLGNWVNGMRLGIIYPIAFSFAFFGVNDLSVALYPLLCSLGSIIVIFLLGKRMINPQAGLIGALLLAVFPINIIYSTWPMPDVPLALFGALSILLFFKAQELNTGWKRRMLFGLSGLLIGWCYLHKISGMIFILFLCPVMIYYMLKQKRIDWDYAFFFFGLGILVLAESIFYYIYSGDLLARYHTVTGFFQQGRAGLNPNMWYHPRNMFNFAHGRYLWGNKYLVQYGLFYYFFAAATVFLILRLIFKKDTKWLMPFFWFITLFAYLEFGSMKLTHFVPIHKLARHLTVLTIPGILLIVYSLYTLKPKWVKYTFGSIIVGFLVISSIYFAANTHQYLYASTYDIKQMHEYFKGYTKLPIYVDLGTYYHLIFYFQYERNKQIKNFAFVNLTNLHNSLIVVNGSRGVLENSLGANMVPGFFQKPLPQNWEKLQTIKGPEIAVWSRYNPEIYYIK